MRSIQDRSDALKAANRADEWQPQLSLGARGAPVDSRLLLGCGEELLIAHGAELYHLRITRQNKLILTK